MSINKKELIEIIANEQDQLPYKDIELSVKTIIESMIDSLTKGKRIEIRGFGSFSLRYRKSRIGRNPKSGESVNIDERYVPHFKPGKDLKERVKTNWLIFKSFNAFWQYLLFIINILGICPFGLLFFEILW